MLRPLVVMCAFGFAVALPMSTMTSKPMTLLKGIEPLLLSENTVVKTWGSLGALLGTTGVLSPSLFAQALLAPPPATPVEGQLISVSSLPNVASGAFLLAMAKQQPINLVLGLMNLAYLPVLAAHTFHPNGLVKKNKLDTGKMVLCMAALSFFSMAFLSKGIINQDAVVQLWTAVTMAYSVGCVFFPDKVWATLGGDRKAMTPGVREWMMEIGFNSSSMAVLVYLVHMGKGLSYGLVSSFSIILSHFIYHLGTGSWKNHGLTNPAPYYAFLPMIGVFIASCLRNIS